MAKNITIESPIKIIGTGKVPNTTDLKTGQIAVGKVSNRMSAYANIGNASNVNLLEYDKTLNDAVQSAVKLGDFNVGTTPKALENMTISQIIDKMLFPVTQPTFTKYFASISFTDTFKPEGLYEVGTPAPKYGQLQSSLSRGSATFNPGKNLIGAVVQDSIKYTRTTSIGTEQIIENTMAHVIVEGVNKYTVNMNYLAGDTIFNSHGGKAEINTNVGFIKNPMDPGSISTSINIYGVYPYFAYVDTNKNTPFTKLALTNNSWIRFVCPPEDTIRHQFAIPKKYSIQKIEYYDTVAKEFKLFNKDNFTAEPWETKNGVEYLKYVRNEVAKSGETEFLVTFNKI